MNAKPVKVGRKIIGWSCGVCGYVDCASRVVHGREKTRMEECCICATCKAPITTGGPSTQCGACRDKERTERESVAFHNRAMRDSLAGVLAAHTVDGDRSPQEHSSRWHSRVRRTKNLARLRFTDRGVYLANHEFYPWAEDRVRDACELKRFAELIALARDCCAYHLDAYASIDVAAVTEAIECRGLLKRATIEENLSAWWQSCPQSGTPACGYDKPRESCSYCHGAGYITRAMAGTVLTFLAVARLGGDAIDTAASLARTPMLGGDGAQVAWAVVSRRDLRYYHERNEGHRLCELFSAIELKADWRGEPFAREDAEELARLRQLRECGVHLWRCAPGRVVFLVEAIPYVRFPTKWPRKWQRKVLGQ